MLHENYIWDILEDGKTISPGLWYSDFYDTIYIYDAVGSSDGTVKLRTYSFNEDPTSGEYQKGRLYDVVLDITEMNNGRIVMYTAYDDQWKEFGYIGKLVEGMIPLHMQNGN